MIIGVERERDDGELETDDGESEADQVTVVHEVTVVDAEGVVHKGGGRDEQEPPRKKTRTENKADSPSD